ncbi:MAG: LptE family protein [Flavobacteriales bacterium]
MEYLDSMIKCYKKTQKYVCIVLCIVCFAFVSSCYSLNGSSLDPSIKTVQIDLFPNYAPLQNVTLSQNFTNDLRDRFQQRTPLDVVKNNGDILISGEITNYTESYSTVTSDEQAQQNRLTIGIKVNYVNNLDDTKSFSKTFQDYEDYPGNQTLTQVEGSIVPDITERIIDQIYNAIVTDW